MMCKYSCLVGFVLLFFLVTCKNSSDIYTPVSQAPLPVYTLSLSSSDTAKGSVSANGSQSLSIQQGKTTQAAAAATSGNYFTGWSVTSGSGAVIVHSGSETTIIKLTSGSVTVQGTFAAIPSEIYVLTIEQMSGGSVSSTSTATNNVINISATPASGFSFTEWEILSGSASFADQSAANTTITLGSNAEIEPLFTANAGTSGISSATGESSTGEASSGGPQNISVSLSLSPTSVTTSTSSVTVSAATSPSVSGGSYQWFVNGSLVGSTSTSSIALSALPSDSTGIHKGNYNITCLVSYNGWSYSGQINLVVSQ